MIRTGSGGAVLAFILGGLSACSSSGAAGDGGCQAETDQTFCVRLGKNCDILSAFDNCGASRSVNCGSCGGSCVDNLCKSANTSGGTSGASAGASAGTTGGASVSGGSTGGVTTGSATTGGTTGGVDGGCTSTFCGGYADILTANFVLTSFANHGDSTLDGLVSENLTMIIGFNGGTPVDAGGTYTFPSSPVQIAVSGDDAGVIASRMLSTWTQDGGINIFEDVTGFFDLELRPSNQSGAWFGLEFQCYGTETLGAPLVSTSCANPGATLRYFGTQAFDELSSTAATISLYVGDGG